MNAKTKTDAGTPDIRWLLAGAAGGLIVAAVGILRQTDAGTELPEEVLASVNGRYIEREQFDRALARLGANAESTDDAARVLERLVDDELLVQRGLELGMPQSDLSVRTAIINSLVASVTAEADAASPSDEELERYLADNAGRFSYVAELAVSAWQSDDEAVAQAFVTALRTDGNVDPSDAIEAVPGLPDGMTPIEGLRDYLGPGITAAAADMPIGSSAVFARRGRWLVVQVLDKKMAAMTELEPIRNRVLLDYRRSLAESTLRAYLDDLRRRADVVVVAP
ncbi:MAG: peptidylprolyl isomerase [Woeseiaceae bacterium]|nr:peptidylprolyl isomerase [Woeseiaceae bacterium]